MAQQTKTAGGSNTLLLIGIVILLAIIPLVIVPAFVDSETEFGGADGMAEEVIAEINPDVQPWFQPFWEPPGGETESLLFALQAALGAGIVGYYIGLKKGEHNALKD